MTANLVLRMTTTGDKSGSGIAKKRLVAMFCLRVFGDLGMTKKTRGYKSCQPIKSNLMWPKNKFFDNDEVLFKLTNFILILNLFHTFKGQWGIFQQLVYR